MSYNYEMVETNLPFEIQDAKRLKYLFLDLNAYFASVEQQERPELRGRPIAVLPLMADSTCVIAASYEAKAFGIKTGTRVSDAKEMCRDIELIEARPTVYVKYHERVKAAVESVLPVQKVCSIDEMYCKLIGIEQESNKARTLAASIKSAIAEGAGEMLRCSIGIAPNAFLAKLATDLQKPDGLVVLEAHELGERLKGLPLTEFAGINKRMAARLQSAGIFRSDDMLSASKDELRSAFGSITGERWWYLLRGFDLQMEEHAQKTLGHSHVLSPELRTDQGCREVLLRITSKACARLRSAGLWATSMSVYVRGKKSWDARSKLPPTQDTLTVTETLLKLWESRDFSGPTAVGITFHEMREAIEVTPSLFDPTFDRANLSHAVDHMNQKFGKNKVFLAAMEHAKDSADEKIAFQKTTLFSEGKGDNE